MNVARTYLGIGEKTVREGIDAGIWDTKEPKIALQAIMGMLNSWLHWFNPLERLTLEETAEVMADYAEAILRGGEAGVGTEVREARKRASQQPERLSGVLSPL